jgi:Cu+-exporting ATPase
MKHDDAAEHRDPVCGMTVDPQTAPHHADHQGEVFHFCSAGCRDKFVADPDRYPREGAGSNHDDVPEGTIYTCPMHPEIRQVGPGSCPICGMALEPEQFSLDDGPDPEYLDMRRRFWVSAFFTLPLFVYAMGDIIPGQPLARLLAADWAPWAQFALATPVVLWGAFPFFVRGIQSLRSMNLNMFTLIGLGVAVAFGFSAVATIAPQIFPPAFHDMPPPSSQRWFCWGKFSNSRLAARHQAR